MERARRACIPCAGYGSRPGQEEHGRHRLAGRIFRRAREQSGV